MALRRAGELRSGWDKAVAEFEILGDPAQRLNEIINDKRPSGVRGANFALHSSFAHSLVTPAIVVILRDT
jgi:hypothetical protein